MAEVIIALLLGLVIAGLAYGLGYLMGRAHRTVIEKTTTEVRHHVSWLPSQHREASVRRAIEQGVASAVRAHSRRGIV
jgi:hypothetical protein